MAANFSLDHGDLSAQEIARAADVATRAFLDDKYFCYLMPDERVRARALPLLFAGQLRHGGDHAHAVCARDEGRNIVAVALWVEPGHWPPPLSLQLAQMPSSLRALYRHPQTLRRAGTYLRTILKVHPKELNWYLPLLAVDPSVQGRGVGTMLMNEAVARMDADGVGGYLETQKEENHAFYNRFGYELRDTLHPVPDGPAYYTMWRPAR
ncbi:MAG: GNAT family N-acetyltransferase [Acidimicrobiales bacterium]|jgi:GNAT superfamily N-acetyltransferase